MVGRRGSTGLVFKHQRGRLRRVGGWLCGWERREVVISLFIPFWDGRQVAGHSLCRGDGGDRCMSRMGKEVIHHGPYVRVEPGAVALPGPANGNVKCGVVGCSVGE